MKEMIKIDFKKRIKTKKKMPDYQLGKIYAIRSPSTDKFYIGSTTQKLSKRFGGHKTELKNRKNKLCNSRTILEKGDAYIELIEAYPCNNKEELKRREGELQRLHKELCVNKQIAGRTKQEYYGDNIEKIKEYVRDWSSNNKEKVNEYRKKWRDENKEKIAEIQRRYRANKKINTFHL